MLALSACSAPTAHQTEARAHPTIVSLNPCSDAVLAEIAGPEQLLGISSYSHSAASSSMDLTLARRFASVSGSVEEIAALSPDVVVAGTMLSPATVSALDRLGIRLVQLPIASDVDASLAQVRQLAALAGQPQRGEAMAARIEAALAKAAPAGKAVPVEAIVWQSGGIVAGDDTLIADILRRTGFINGAAARGLGQAQYLPLERMLAEPPQVIFETGDARSDEDRLLAHPALASLQNTKRAHLDPSLLWCGGPTIVRAAQRLGAVRVAVRQGASTGSGRAELGEKTPLTLSLSKGARP